MPAQIVFGVVGHLKHRIRGHVGEAVARDRIGRGDGAREAGPRLAGVLRAEDLGQTRGGEEDVGGVGVGGVGRHVGHEVSHGLHAGRGEGHERVAAVGGAERRVARAEHGVARVDDLRVRRRGHDDARHRRAVVPPARHVERALGPEAAEVVGAPRGRLAAHVEHVRVGFHLVDARRERAERRGARLGQARRGLGEAHTAVGGAEEAVVVERPHHQRAVALIPGGVEAVAADAVVPRRGGRRAIRRGPRAVVLQSGDELVGPGALVGAVGLGGVVGVERLDPGRVRGARDGADVVGEGDAAVGAVEEAEAASVGDGEQRVVVGVRVTRRGAGVAPDALAGERHAGVGGRGGRVEAVDVHTGHVDAVLVDRVDGEGVVVPALAVEHVRRSAGELRPRLPGVGGAVVARHRCRRLDLRVEVRGVLRGEGDLVAAARAKARPHLRPRGAAVARADHAEAVDGGVERAGPQRVGDDLLDAPRAVHVHLLPRRAVVHRAVQPHVRRRDHGVLTRAEDHQTVHVREAVEAVRRGQKRPRVAPVRGAEDAVAAHGVAVAKALARAGVEHVRVAGAAGDAGEGEVVEVGGHVRPRGAGVAGLPEAAVDAGHEPGGEGASGVGADDAGASAHVAGADLGDGHDALQGAGAGAGGTGGGGVVEGLRGLYAVPGAVLGLAADAAADALLVGDRTGRARRSRPPCPRRARPSARPRARWRGGAPLPLRPRARRSRSGRRVRLWRGSRAGVPRGLPAGLRAAPR